MGESKSLKVVNKDLVEEENATELLEAQAHIFNHICSYVNSGALKCATQLGILDIIHSHGMPMTLSQLISSLPIHHSKTPFVYPIMRILVHSGFFRLEKIDGEEGYVLTLASKLLLKDNPFSMTPFLAAILHPILTSLWDTLSTWFQNDDPTPFYTTHGMKFWDYTVLHPELSGKFNESMACDARLATRMVMDRCKGVFEGLESLVDVGGGTGTMAKAIANAFPRLECTVFDLPHVVGDLQGSKNLKYVGGDMFDAIPSAEAVLLKSVLHDWTDEECVKILERCKHAITTRKGSKGKVIIVEMMISENDTKGDVSTQTKLCFDMMMMTMLSGKERSEKEWAQIFSRTFYLLEFCDIPFCLLFLLFLYVRVVDPPWRLGLTHSAQVGVYLNIPS